MNALALLAVLATYGLSLHDDFNGYVALAGSEFEALDNPLGQFGVRYPLRDSNVHSVALFYDHLSSLADEDDSTGLNRVGLRYHHRLGFGRGWAFYSSAGVRARGFDYAALREHDVLFIDAGVERALGAWGKFSVSAFAAALYGGDAYVHSGVRVGY